MERTEAIALVRQYVHDEALVNHCLATGAIMKALAIPLNGDPAQWEEIGILHDIDYELVKGDMQQHGVMGAEMLRKAGRSGDISRIVQGHNHLLHTGSYTEPVEIALQAADSASGLIIACALVKSGKLSDVSVKTITKKAKEKSFAAGCDRGRIALIGSLMEIPVFYDHALRGLREIQADLGLS